MFEELTIASLPCSDGYSTTLKTISLTRPQGALAVIKVKHQFLFFEHAFLHNRRQFSVEVFSQAIGSRIVKDIVTVCYVPFLLLVDWLNFSLFCLVRIAHKIN